MMQKQENNAGRPSSQERQNQSGKQSRDQRSEGRETGAGYGKDK